MNEVVVRGHQCPLCGEIQFTQHRLGLLRCKSCTLVLSPSIWEPQANQHMEDEWFGEDYETRKTSIWVAWFQAWNNRKTLARLNAYSGQKTRLLEIGVGSGSFLKAAKERGFDVMGCDLSAPICRSVDREYGIAMHCGVLSELPDINRSDVVVMNHVLEHVQQPVDFLQDVHRLLTAEGIIHIAVPNIDCWEAGLSGWTSYEPYHLTYFNRQTLLRAVELAGFSVIRIQTSESFSGWFLALLRSALGVNRAQGAVTRSVTTSTSHLATSRPALVEHGYRFAMVIIGGGLWPLRWLQGKLGCGDEITCIARKSSLCPED